MFAPDRPDITIEAGSTVLDHRDSNSPIEDLAEANPRKRARQQSREEEETDRIRINTLGTNSLGLLANGIKFDTTPRPPSRQTEGRHGRSFGDWNESTASSG